MNGGASSSEKSTKSGKLGKTAGLSPPPYVELARGEHPDGFVLGPPLLVNFKNSLAEKQKAAEEAERREQEELLAAGYIPHSRKHRLLSSASSASTEMDCTEEEEEKGDFASSVEPSPTAAETAPHVAKRNRNF